MTDATLSFERTSVPAYKAVATEIESMLASGSLKPGEPLPNEIDFAAQFGVNRSTIRESLRLLEDTGYVERVSPRKLIAAIPDAKSLATRTSRALFVNRVTMRQIWETNLAVEPHMARHAALTANPEQIAALRSNIDETMLRQNNGNDLSDLDEQFHALLGAASNHMAMLIAMEPYSALFLPIVDGLIHRTDVGVRLVVAHERIVEAIERRDADVAELWSRRHLLDFERGCKLAGIDIDVPFGSEVLENIK